ncbi:MAG TPA: hypothetical protein VGC41_27040, partial [Kofleriaceae bacterium]
MAREHIMPTIRSGAFLAHFELEAIVAGLAPLNVPRIQLAYDLFETFVVESANGMITVTAAMRATWDVELSELRDAAMINLNKRTHRVGFNRKSGMGTGISHDGYEASRVLVPGSIHAACKNPYVVLRSRDDLVFADPNHPSAMFQLLDLMPLDEAVQNSR